MKTSDVVQHFGSKAATARALGITRVAVTRWPDRVPLGSALLIQRKTRKRLSVDLADYPRPLVRFNDHGGAQTPRTADVVRYFGSKAATARALGITRAAVTQWPERVPACSALQMRRLLGRRFRLVVEPGNPA